LRVES